MKPIRWVVGVTTGPERKDDLLGKTLASLKAGGFPTPRLFVDNCTASDALWYKLTHGCEVTHREPPKLKAWGNWWLALAELYLRDPVAHRYAIFQDDVLCLRNLRPYLDRQPFPDKGYWNLYSAFENEQVIAGQAPGSWHEGHRLGRGPSDARRLQKGLGALGLVFSREGVQLLLSSSCLAAKPANADGRHDKFIDGAVVTAMNEARSKEAPCGWREWIHAPTLVYHLGTRKLGHLSTIEAKPGVNSNWPHALSWRGEDFDAMGLSCEGKARTATEVST